jgi:hypothetical protein
VRTICVQKLEQIVRANGGTNISDYPPALETWQTLRTAHRSGSPRWLPGPQRYLANSQSVDEHSCESRLVEQSARADQEGINPGKKDRATVSLSLVRPD